MTNCDGETMYKIYVSQSACYYGGISLIAANSAEEANKKIERFKQSDIGDILQYMKMMSLKELIPRMMVLFTVEFIIQVKEEL